MAEHAAHPPRSERFIKAYLFVWGLLAAGGLTYLATLVWQPDWLAPPARRTQIAEPEPDSALRMASRAVVKLAGRRQDPDINPDRVARLRSHIHADYRLRDRSLAMPHT